MKKLYMREKIVSVRGRFTIKDEEGDDVYHVSGSFMKIPKSFYIKNNDGEEVAVITKKILSLLPKFFVEVDDKEVLTISKELSVFKARYSIVGSGLEVKGNWWDMDFEVYRKGKVVGEVRKKWISIGDSYEIKVYEPAMEKILIAIVVAIDCVKEDRDSPSS